MKKINIVVMKIINRNLGDGVIADNTRYLIEKAIPFYHKNKYNIIPYNIYSRNTAVLKMADMLVLVGGGVIKYKYEHFYEYIAEIIDVADEYKIPVFLNAVGIEGFDAEDERCIMLKKAINRPCVKAITVRDDYDTLKDCYIENPNIITQKVIDPAVWTVDTYGLKADKHSDIVGLGIIRYRIFEDYGIEGIGHDFQLEFWKQIIDKLNSHNVKWKVFTNGLKSDEAFAVEVLQYAGYGKEIATYKEERQARPIDLVKMIASFRGIIACRMHANIVAYALRIPSVGIVWNDKLSFWGDIIGHPERFLTPEQMNADIVVNALFRAMSEPQQPPSAKMKKSTFSALKSFISKYGQKREELAFTNGLAYIDWQKHLMATALGGENHQFCNMNTAQTIQSSYDAGFRWMEADVRLTSDNRLVCVNGWNNTIYKKLEIDEEGAASGALTYDAFMHQKYYNIFPTLDFSELMERMKNYPNVKLLLDIGKPALEILPLYYEQLLAGVPEEIRENVMIRVQREKDVQMAKAKKMPFALAYYLPESSTAEKMDKIMDFCIKNQIEWVTMKTSAFSKQVGEKLKQANLKSCLFSCDSLEQAHNYIADGADMISTHYLKIDELNLLMGKELR